MVTRGDFFSVVGWFSRRYFERTRAVQTVDLYKNAHDRLQQTRDSITSVADIQEFIASIDQGKTNRAKGYSVPPAPAPEVSR